MSRRPPRLGASDAPPLPRPVRLIALDLDGTAVDLEQRVHPRTRAAVRRAVAAGIHVVAATGRMYRSALPWTVELGLRDPLVCYQGAVVRELPVEGDPVVGGVPQGRLVVEEGLPGPVALRALEAARCGGWHCQGYRDDRLLCERDGPAADFYARIAQVGYELVPDLGPLLAAGSTKLVCVVLDAAEAASCEAALREALRGDARVVRSLDQFVEVTNPRAGKGRQLRRLLERYGVAASEAIAVGDAPNDIDMLELCGLGVAVATAGAAVLAAADLVVAPPQEAGVADLVEAVLAAA